MLEYCKYHTDAKKAGTEAKVEDMKAFDADFVKVDQGTLFELILVRRGRGGIGIALCRLSCRCVRPRGARSPTMRTRRPTI